MACKIFHQTEIPLYALFYQKSISQAHADSLVTFWTYADSLVMRIMANIEETILQELCSLLDITSPTIIDQNASFQMLGGTSLLALKLVSRCKRIGLKLLVNDVLQSKSISDIVASVSQLDSLYEDESQSRAESRFPEPKIQRIANVIDAGSATAGHKSELTMITSSELPYEEDETICTKDESGPIQPGEFQFALIHESIKIPGSNLIQHFEVYKSEDIPRVKFGWRTVWEQHPLLRMRFAQDLELFEDKRFDWREVYTEDPQEYEEWICGARVQKTTDSFGSSWRVVSLINNSESKSVIIWAIHHALIDGYSAKLLLAKMRLAASGKPIAPGPAFSGIVRDLETFREQHKSEGNAFWDKEKDLHAQAGKALQFPPPNDLTLCKTDTQSQSDNHGYGEHHIYLGASWNGGCLAGIARQAGVTPAVIYHAAWGVVMTVFADSDTVCFGTALSGRNIPIAGVEEAIGPLINTLPLALRVAHTAVTLRDLARETQQRLNELAQYSWTTPDHGFSRDFQCMLAMQYQMDDHSICVIDDEVDKEGHAAHPVERPFTRQTSNVPLTVLVDDAYDRIRLQYSIESFLPSQIEHLGALYKRVLHYFVRLDTRLSLVQENLVTPESQRKLETWGNCLSSTTGPLSVVDDLVTLFEGSVDRNPDSLAAQVGRTGMHLTYCQLNKKASTVANVLYYKHGVRPGDIVCVDANRSLEWLVSIFGVLKTGAAFCALDHELPHHLRSVMFMKAGANVFLASTRKDANKRCPIECCLNLSVEDLLDSANNEMEEPRGSKRFNPQRRDVPMPESIAYLCFTSGSTGTPKGVLCTHQGLVAFQRDLEVRLFAQPGVKVAQIMSPAFDGSIHEIFSALCHGATLVLPSPGHLNVTEPLSLAQSAILTPSLAEVLDPSDYPALKYVYLVGEQVKQTTNDRWAAVKDLYNMYGPTEGTGGATIQRLRRGVPVTIGRPNPSTRVYILASSDPASRGLRLMPPGTIGEICVAGVQVASGYHGMPDLTSERFVPDPFCRTGTGDLLYKTGDRGYWSSTGEIVCLGRQDRQIKLRGFRLDLNDLEARVMQAAIPRITGLKSIAIAQRKDYLIAAIQPATLALSNEIVAAVMNEVLPIYAQPRQIVFVDEWPMTRAGKLDYKTIVSDLFVQGSMEKNKMARSEANVQLSSSLTTLEARIASVWREVLRLSPCEPIGSQTGFFQLGGDSLRQITMLAKLSSSLKTKVPLKIIIESCTLGELTRRLEEFEPRLRHDMKQLPYPSSALHDKIQYRKVSLGLPRCTPLSPVELAWWTSYRSHPGSNTSAFNVSFVTSIGDGINHEALCRALDSVVSRYSLFRGRYVPVGSGQGVRDHCCGMVERRYVAHSPKVQRLRYLNVWAEVNKPFDLEHDPPIRICVTHDTMSIVMSHIVADLTTLNILMQEVGILYHGKPLPPVSRSYEQETVPEMWRKEASLCDLEFWTQYLHPSSRRPRELLTTPQHNRYCGTSRLYRLSDHLAKRLTRFCTGQKSSIAPSLQQMAVAVVGLAIAALQDQGSDPSNLDANETDVVLGIPFINRSSADDMETVGLFLEPLPVRVHYTAKGSRSNGQKQDAQDFLDSVCSSAKTALAHAVPWYRLVAHLADVYCPQSSGPSLTSASSATEPRAPFSTMVTFHTVDNGVSIDIPGLKPRITWGDGAKFSLMTEFTALANGSIILRTEYDTQQYMTSHIDRLVSAIASAFDMLISSEQSVAEIKVSLRDSLPTLNPLFVSSIQGNGFGIAAEDLATACTRIQHESIPKIVDLSDNGSYTITKSTTPCDWSAKSFIDRTLPADYEQVSGREIDRKRVTVTEQSLLIGAAVV